MPCLVPVKPMFGIVEINASFAHKGLKGHTLNIANNIELLLIIFNKAI